MPSSVVGPRALHLAALGCAVALILALTGCGRLSRASGAAASATVASRPGSALTPAEAGSTYTLMQMNLCLSGLASCYRKVAYPAVLAEAEVVIGQARPDAVTFNEACRNDVALIAHRTGYHLSFSHLFYGGRPLPCIRPLGRGFFGDAVLTKAPILSSDSRAFPAQTDIEWRQWVCVRTRGDIDACTAHLSERTPMEVAGNDAQCVELSALLARLASIRTVIFGGDLNRRSSCAPAGYWVRTDRSAHQDPGLQQVYGTGALREPSVEVLPAMHTDHDILLVRSRLAPRAPRSPRPTL